MIADMAPAIRGAIAHEAATWETLPLSQAHLTGDLEAKPTPIRAPMIVSIITFSQHVERVYTLGKKENPPLLLKQKQKKKQKIDYTRTCC